MNGGGPHVYTVGVSSIPPIKTADLCDAPSPDLQVAEPIFRDFGGRKSFHGRMVTLQVFEDNSLVRAELAQDGHGRVLVIDGGGSLRCALVGDRLAALAASNGWTGIVVHGCIRDAEEIGGIPIGIKALAAMPRKSVKEGKGKRNLPVTFAGVTFRPDAMLVADPDGILITDTLP